MNSKGLTVREIAEKTGYTINGVRAMLHRMNIKTNPARPKIGDSELRKLWREGKRINEISKMSGIGKDTIRSRLKELGLYSRYDIYEMSADEPDCFNCPFPDCRWKQHGPCPAQKKKK